MADHRVNYVVEAFNVVEDVGSGLVAGARAFLSDALRLERREEAFHRRVIPDIPGSAHRADDAVVSRRPLELIAGVSAALVRMMRKGVRLGRDHTSRRSSKTKVVIFLVAVKEAPRRRSELFQCMSKVLSAIAELGVRTTVHPHRASVAPQDCLRRRIAPCTRSIARQRIALNALTQNGLPSAETTDPTTSPPTFSRPHNGRTGFARVGLIDLETGMLNRGHIALRDLVERARGSAASA